MASTEEESQMNKDEPSQETVSPEEPPRQKLISTAVTFLQNSKVKSSPLWQRKAFLKKKGLTDEEIKIAVEKSGITENNEGEPNLASPGNGSIVIQPVPAKPSTLTRIYQVTSTVSMVTGLTFAAYQFYQRFIKPFLYSLPTPDDRLEKLEKSTVELETTLVQTLKKIQETLNCVQEVVIKQDKLQAVARSDERERTKLQNELSVTEIKSEIQSIKGLLLSRKQFPPPPASKPTLPAWQLTDSVSPSSSSVSANESSSVTTVDSNEKQTAEDNSADLRLKAVNSEDIIPGEKLLGPDLSSQDTEIAESELNTNINGTIEEGKQKSDSVVKTNVNFSNNSRSDLEVNGNESIETDVKS